MNRTMIIAAAAAAMGVAAPATAGTPSASVSPDKDATAKALILVPLTLTKIDDLDFGTIVPSSVSGFVSINATSGARSFGGGVTGAASAQGHRAYFGGGGTANQQVFVSIDAPTQLTSPAGDSIIVLGLTVDGSSRKTIDPTTRAFFVGVGGTLEIAADQPEGIYSGTFDVYANYL